MNFFRDKELAERFAADNVSEREMFYYFFIILLVVEVVTSSYSIKFLTEEISNWDYILDFIAVPSTIIGTIWIYYINSLGDGKNFVARFISLSFPVFIKSLAILIVLGTILAITEIVREEVYKLESFSGEVISKYYLGMIVLANLYYYLRLAYAMKIASRPTGN